MAKETLAGVPGIGPEHQLHFNNGASQVDAMRDFILDGEPLAIFNRLRESYPRGHNPQPKISAVVFRNKICSDVEPVVYAEKMVVDLRTKWLPTWKAGRLVPDFHRWIAEYDPDADIGPANGRQVDPCTCTWERQDPACPVHPAGGRGYVRA